MNELKENKLYKLTDVFQHPKSMGGFEPPHFPQVIKCCLTDCY